MDKDRIRIVPVCEKDAEFLYRLMNCPAILQRLNEVATTRQDWADAISEWARDDDEEDYIIFEEDIPVGWLGINGLLNDDLTAYLKIAALLPEFQGRGIGSFVIRELVQSLKRRGIEQVVLFTDRDNLTAQACYRKCGFRIAESLTDTMSNGKTVQRYRMVYDCR